MKTNALTVWLYLHGTNCALTVRGLRVAPETLTLMTTLSAALGVRMNAGSTQTDKLTDNLTTQNGPSYRSRPASDRRFKQLVSVF